MTEPTTDWVEVDSDPELNEWISSGTNSSAPPSPQSLPMSPPNEMPPLSVSSAIPTESSEVNPVSVMQNAQESAPDSPIEEEASPHKMRRSDELPEISRTQFSEMFPDPSQFGMPELSRDLLETFPSSTRFDMPVLSRDNSSDSGKFGKSQIAREAEQRRKQKEKEAGPSISMQNLHGQNIEGIEELPAQDPLDEPSSPTCFSLAACRATGRRIAKGIESAFNALDERLAPYVVAPFTACSKRAESDPPRPKQF